MSGAKARRPDRNRLMEDAQTRKLDCLLVWKLDRFGRSLVDCLNNIRTLEENGIRFIAVPFPHGAGCWRGFFAAGYADRSEGELMPDHNKRM